HDDAGALPSRLPDAQMQDGNLLFGIQPDDDDELRALDVAVRDGHPTGRLGPFGREGRRVAGERTGVDVVRSKPGAGEFRERVRVLVGEPPAGEHRSPTAPTPGRDGGEGLVERGRLETMIAQERRRQSGRLVHEREGEPALVAGPRVVDVEVVASELTDDLPAPQVDAE